MTLPSRIVASCEAMFRKINRPRRFRRKKKKQQKNKKKSAPNFLRPQRAQVLVAAKLGGVVCILGRATGLPTYTAVVDVAQSVCFEMDLCVTSCHCVWQRKAVLTDEILHLFGMRSRLGCESNLLNDIDQKKPIEPLLLLLRK